MGDTATIRRNVTICLGDDPDLSATIAAYHRVKVALSAPCFNDGRPLTAFQLYRVRPPELKGVLTSQMATNAMRQVAASYRAAKSNGHAITRPFEFKRPYATFSVGRDRKRDATLRKDGTLSIWTVAGRKYIGYTVPEPFKKTLAEATVVGSITLVERGQRLLGRVSLDLEVPAPTGTDPVGIDLNETNALVAVAGDKVFFESGQPHRVRNRRTQKTRARLQRALVERKVGGRDTRSVRRLLKRQSRKQRNRTRTFCQTTAKRLVEWAPEGSVLVLEDLKKIPKRRKGDNTRPSIRRRVNQWPHHLMAQCIANKAEERGVLVATVSPHNTSRLCSQCGEPGDRSRHKFSCPSCGHRDHADINAARNIAQKFTALRCRALPPTSAEALTTTAKGKTPPRGGSVGPIAEFFTGGVQ